MTHERLTKELDAQEAARGPSADIELLRHFLKCCQSKSQWLAFTRVEWESTRPASWPTIRRWHPIEGLRQLVEGYKP